MDPSHFHKQNVADTCAIWNLLASITFYGAARAVGCNFCCTQFVVYECLHKPRSRKLTTEEEELRERFRKEHNRQLIKSYKITIQDLQTVELLANRKRISKGELSSIAFAIQTRQAFLSDDKGALKLALTEIDNAMVQTTSLLFGWLFFHDYLSDHHKEQIISELETHGRYMRKHYEDVYNRALEIKLMGMSTTKTTRQQGTGIS
jgi:predicted nucleic acid-binding protein